MDRRTSPHPPPGVPTAGDALAVGRAQLIESEPGERERIRARLEVLLRVKEGIAPDDRPAMFHAVLQLIKLESSALRRLEPGSGAGG